jgi:ionotropic glutamate receptor
MTSRVLLILSVLMCCCKPETLKIGAIFDIEAEVKEKAFQLAIDAVNTKRTGDERYLEGLVEYVPCDNPFKAMVATCRLVSNGVVAILGPSSQDNAQMVQTICDDKDVPLLDARWVGRPKGPTISFYPHQGVLTRVYMEVLDAWNFQDFVVLYENDDSLRRMGELLKGYDSKEHQIVVRQLDKYQNGNYRPTLKEVWRSGATHFVLDCSTEILEEVLLQAQQVGLMTNKQFYFITNLDMHTLNLTPFQYAETNITGV